MEEVLPQTGASTAPCRDSARWYLATTLAERIHSLQKSAVAHFNRERAKKRLEQWKRQVPFHKSEQTFAQRLAMDELTEESLLTLLAQPAEAIQASFSTPPVWLVELLKAFDQQDSSVLVALPVQKLDDS